MHTELETLREDGPGGRGGRDEAAGPGLVATARRMWSFVTATLGHVNAARVPRGAAF